MGFLSNIGPALTAASQGVASYDQGQRQGVNDAFAKQLQLQAVARQQQNDVLNRALTQAQIGDVESQRRLRDTQADGDWSKPEGVTIDGPDGKPINITVQTNKRTGKLRQGVIEPPETPPVASGAAASHASAGPTGSIALPPDSQQMEGDAEPPQAAQQGSPQRPPPVASVVRPYVKPSPTANDLTPHNFAVDGKPVAGFTDKRGQHYDASGQLIATGRITPYVAPDKPDRVLVQTVGPDGQPVYTSRADAAGKTAPGKSGAAAANAQVMSKEGQFGEMLKKADDLFQASDKMDVGLGQSAAKDIATKGIGVGPIHIPGTQGLGSMLLNQTPTYAAYQAALDPFVLANAHALSGARINQDQANMIKQSIERKPGDLANPQVSKQKEKNIIDQMNSIAATLPADAVAAQEAQMDPATLERLRARGYRGAAVSHSGGRGGGKGGGGGTQTTLTPAQIHRAQVDPDYKQFLQATGKLPPEGE